MKEIERCSNHTWERQTSTAVMAALEEVGQPQGNRDSAVCVGL